MGDGFLATFDGPARAIRCAAAVRGRGGALGIEVRAGIHTGEVELIGDDVGGMAVNIGARIGALADPGEVLVSSTVRELVVGSGIEFDDRGAAHAEGRARRVAPLRSLLALATSDRVDARTAFTPIEPATPAQPVGAAPALEDVAAAGTPEDVGTALTEHPVPAGSRKDAVGGPSGANTVAPAAGADEVTARPASMKSLPPRATITSGPAVPVR